MNVWRNIPTIFNQRRVLRIAGIISLCVALITTLLFGSVSRAAPGINQTLSFQGRLLTASGGVVPDGYYNMQFKIYQDGTGTTAGNSGGTLEWTESYVNDSNDEGVQVTNGYFSVNLGSVNPFGSQVDWNQDTLWLSMNIAGSASACTTFGTAPCTADGEMLPMKRMTSTPFALNSAQLGGKTAENFIQLAQGVQEDTLNNTASIFLNKTGTGGEFLKLQNAGVDQFLLKNNGDVQFGNTSDHSIIVGGSDTDVVGKNLLIQSGNGGGGSGSSGGNTSIFGGHAGGTNANGGNVFIQGGDGSGSGDDGAILIGNFNNAYIEVGNTNLSSGSQTINIGTNNGSGGTTNVTIGSGGSSGGGTTTVQSKNDTVVSTGGTQRARFLGSGNTLYVGNADGSGQATTANSFTIQGTSSTGSDTQGGSLTLQSGAATSGNANGGNINLTGGVGSGSGATGLVIINTPTFQTAGTQTCGSNCTITQANLDSNGVVNMNVTAENLTVTLNDPTITTAGRIIYVTAAAGSEEFTLSANSTSTSITMREKTAVTLIWNGSDWLTAGGGSSSLQNAYNNTPQSAGGTEITLNNTVGALTISDSVTDPINGSLLEIRNANAQSLLSVNSIDDKEFASNGGVHTNTASWSATGTSSLTRNTSDGQENSDSAEVDMGTTADNGVRNTLSQNPAISTQYKVSLYAKLVSGSAFNDLDVAYSPDSGSNLIDCTGYNSQTVTTSEWTHITCVIETDTTTVTGAYLYISQPTSPASGRTILIDNLSIVRESTSLQNVQVGNKSTSGGSTTLFTLDNSPHAPGADSTMLGSMYYDTTLGKVQCYEADGWGACGAAPDNFVTLSPEYTNAVMNGTDIGTISSDLCSDMLNINDGSSGQPTICGTDETFNFYNWTSAETAAQTRSIYVTYQLPSTFKEFVSGLTSLMGRTDSTNSTVTYQIYRDDTGNGLTSCGSAISVSTGVQTTWQKATASGADDPAECGFEAGDSILFRINLTAEDDANAYVSNLNFTFSNN